MEEMYPLLCHSAARSAPLKQRGPVSAMGYRDTPTACHQITVNQWPLGWPPSGPISGSGSALANGRWNSYAESEGLRPAPTQSRQWYAVWLM